LEVQLGQNSHKRKLKTDAMKKQLKMKGLDWLRKLKRMNNEGKMKLRKSSLLSKSLKFKSGRKFNSKRLRK
jgi:peroxiredoxin family protein